MNEGNVIYIAGPMAGLIDWGRENFRKAEEYLRGRFGWIVLNPAVLPVGMPETRYMPICLSMLQQADAIGMLPGWEDSAGALLEFEYANQTGKRVIILEEDYGFSYDDVEEEGGKQDGKAMDDPGADGAPRMDE